MGRKVNAKPVGVIYPFVPESFGNKSDPAPITIHLKPGSERTKRQLAHLISEGTVSFSSIELRGVLEKLIDHVEEYTDANGRPIVTGRQLFEHGEAEILGEVVSELVDSQEYDEDDRKNSES